MELPVAEPSTQTLTCLPPNPRRCTRSVCGGSGCPSASHWAPSARAMGWRRQWYSGMGCWSSLLPATSGGWWARAQFCCPCHMHRGGAGPCWQCGGLCAVVVPEASTAEY